MSEEVRVVARGRSEGNERAPGPRERARNLLGRGSGADAEKLQVRLEAEIAKSEARLRTQLSEIAGRIGALAAGAERPPSGIEAGEVQALVAQLGRVVEERVQVMDARLEAGLAWLHGALQESAPAQEAGGGKAARLRGLASRLGEVEARVSAVGQDVGVVRQGIDHLAQRPAPEPVDLATVLERLDSLAQRPAPDPVDLAPVLERLDSLAQRPAPGPVDLAPVLERLDSAAPQPFDPAPLLIHMSELRERVDWLVANAATPPATAQSVPAAESPDTDEIAARVAASVQEAMAGSGAREAEREAQIALRLDGLVESVTEGIDRLGRQSELLRTDLVAERRARTLLEGDIGGIRDRLDGVTATLSRLEEGVALAVSRGGDPPAWDGRERRRPALQIEDGTASVEPTTAEQPIVGAARDGAAEPGPEWPDEDTPGVAPWPSLGEPAPPANVPGAGEQPPKKAPTKKKPPAKKAPAKKASAKKEAAKKEPPATKPAPTPRRRGSTAR